MIPIKYPSNIDIVKISYRNRLVKSKEIEIDRINFYLNKIIYRSKKLNFDDLVVYPLEDLLGIEELISKKLGRLQIMKLNRFFNYKKNQKQIADFFMNISGIELNTCFYCNIDYINPFLDLADYDEPLDFVNNANNIELQNLVGVGPKTAGKIIAKKPVGGYKKLSKIPSLHVRVRSQLKFMDFNKTHNHFTLDHVISQSKSKFLSLCFYNFVPSCYSCNSKFKSDKEFANNSDLIQASPSSNKFSIHNNLLFKIYYKGSLTNINLEKDFILGLESDSDIVDEYKSMFKLEGRYNYHKKIVPGIIKNKLNYSESRIKEISELIGVDRNEVRKTIFGQELFDETLTSMPLTKFKRDIAKCIGIKGVL